MYKWISNERTNHAVGKTKTTERGGWSKASAQQRERKEHSIRVGLAQPHIRPDDISVPNQKEKRQAHCPHMTPGVDPILHGWRRNEMNMTTGVEGDGPIDTSTTSRPDKEFFRLSRSAVSCTSKHPINSGPASSPRDRAIDGQPPRPHLVS